MAMVTVTKRFEIAYSHHLPGYRGKCARLHGHNAIIEVSVQGSFLREVTRNASSYYDPNGHYFPFIMDFSLLKDTVNNVLKNYDHHDLNDVFEKESASNLGEASEKIMIPSCEVFASKLFDSIQSEICLRTQGRARLVKIKVTETSDSWVEVEEWS